MNKILSIALLVMFAALPAMAEEVTTDSISSESPAEENKPAYGYKLTDFASVPKFGGYIIGKYSYKDQAGAKGGDGFNVRLIRVYVDGTILDDFKYRIQMELNNTPHVKDFQLEWVKYKEFGVKIGQFKRAFTFENPMNPWDVGVGDYSQLTKKLSGMGDYCGEASMGGRDQGLQIQGDLFPTGADKHRLIHYQLGIWNGQGINTKDINGKKDIIGTLQVQPIKDLFIGVFGWDGSYTAGGVTVSRKRYAIGAKYEHNNWSARAEYAHNSGHKISDLLEDGTWKGTGKADAWYAALGIPCTDWFKMNLRYDVYRDQATWGTTKTIYSVCPTFRLHKNLMIQVQYNLNHDRMLADKKSYNELWVETYVRF